jgi:hydrogenase-4 component B
VSSGASTISTSTAAASITAGAGHGPSRAPAVSGAATIAVGVAGAVCGLAAVDGGIGPVRVSWILPLAGLELAAGATAGVFMVVIGLVGVAAGLFSIGYFRHAPAGRFSLAVLPAFVASMLAVPLAGSVTTFLVMWEIMALASLVAVLTDHRRDEVRDAGRWYAAMTHLGFVAILLGLVVLASSGGSDTFAVLAGRSAGLSSAARNAVLVLTFVGFGSKAGLVPLHVWLPRAHPEAPSPVSALMSAAMVAMGIYGMLRIDVQVLGPGPQWWALMFLVAGGISAVYGVLQASVATDLKRLLAYSTTENMGLITLALGAGMLLADHGERAVAVVAVTAAVLHVIAHAAFKALAFLAAGSVLASTGIRDLDRLGGLITPMPATTAMFSIAALGASGLPLGAGFVSEWLLLQGLIHSRTGSGTLLALVMPLAVGVVALTTGVGVAAMVKAFGVGFLARPRSAEAAGAHESSPTMVAGMGLAAGACAVLAVAPAIVAPALHRVIAQTPLGAGKGQPRLGLLLRLPGIAGSISPALLAVAVVTATAVVTVGAASLGRQRRPPARRAELWACGTGPLTERMEYTATSFAEPLQRVFDNVLRPDVDVEVTHFDESRYLVERVRYHSTIVDAVEVRLYRPLIAAVQVWARWVRRAHPGNVNLYLLYGAIGAAVIFAVAQ